MNTFFIGTDNNFYTKGTLAHFLDTREIAYGEPTSSDIPSSVNPFTLLREAVFKDRLIIARVDFSELDTVPDLKNIDKILKFCVPVDNFLIMWIKLPVIRELPQTVTTHSVLNPIQSVSLIEDTVTLTCNETLNISEI